MYSPQQLYQFIQYAKNYLELQDVQFKSGDNFIDPNNEELKYLREWYLARDDLKHLIPQWVKIKFKLRLGIIYS